MPHSCAPDATRHPQADNASDDALLGGITILDLSQGVAGPYCAMLLQQQGARVIKIEPPAGDWSRQMGRVQSGHTSISAACNAGKESVVLDTRTSAGRAALRQLAIQADVVLQNFRPGVAARMGANAQDLAQHNPRQIYISISGYGSHGPLAQRPAVDTTMQAYSGLMHTNADPASGQPRRIGLIVADLATGLYAAQCATAALFKAARSGRGRHIELSMLQVCAALQSYVIMDDAMFTGQPANNIFNAPGGLFSAQCGGMLHVATLDDAMFKRLAQALGFDDWLHDSTLHSSGGRIPRFTELSQRLGRALAQQPLAHWEQHLRAHDILFAPVRQPRDLPGSEQALALDLFGRTAPDGPWPNLPLARAPGQSLEASSNSARWQVPPLGAHTQAVLREFGIAPCEETTA